METHVWRLILQEWQGIHKNTAISVAHLSGGLTGVFFGTRGSQMCDAGVTRRPPLLPISKAPS